MAGRAHRRRGPFWSAVVLAVVAVGGGGLYAYRGYADNAGPDGAVRGYFAALARSDAADALGYGDLPAGPHNLITATVLREQQQIAPIRGVTIGGVKRNGDSATVHVRYGLRFADGTREINAVVPVKQHGSSWRLTQVAVSTTLQVEQAVRRATIAGAAVPDGTTLLFPGAVPIRFDSPYLELSDSTDNIRFGSGDLTDLSVVVTAAGRQGIATVLQRLLTQCVAGGAAVDAACPLPSDRDVPGSLKGVVHGDLARDLQLGLNADPNGVIAIRGGVTFVGSYQRLTFDNVASSRHGTLRLSVNATAYAVVPLVIGFGGGS